MRQWIGSALVQIMACRRFGAPSHYLNQCWSIVNWTLRDKFQRNLNQNSNISIQENAFENAICQNGGHLVQGGDELTRGPVMLYSHQNGIVILTKFLSFVPPEVVILVRQISSKWQSFSAGIIFFCAPMKSVNRARDWPVKLESFVATLQCNAKWRFELMRLGAF